MPTKNRSAIRPDGVVTKPAMAVGIEPDSSKPIKTQRGPNRSHSGPDINRTSSLNPYISVETCHIPSSAFPRTLPKGLLYWNLRHRSGTCSNLSWLYQSTIKLHIVSIPKTSWIALSDVESWTHQRRKGKPRQKGYEETEPRKEKHPPILVERIENRHREGLVCQRVDFRGRKKAGESVVGHSPYALRRLGHCKSVEVF